MARTPYQSPGVKVIETPNPSFIPVVGALDRLCIIGTARGWESAVERIILQDDPVILSHTGVITSTVVVTNAFNGNIVNPGNYKVELNNDPDTDIDGDETYKITRRSQPSTAPTLAQGTSGALTGTYYYAVSFVNADGETGIGPESTAITVSAKNINLSNIPVGPSGTTARKIYRKKDVTSGGDGNFHLVATINDNTTTTLTGENMDDTTAESTGSLPVQGITSGDSLIINYDYTDQYYYEPTSFDDFDDLADKYGDPFDGDGNIYSELTLASRLAFDNGAGEIVALAVKGTSPSDFSAGLDLLQMEETITMIVPVSSSPAVHSLVASHVTTMNTRGFYRMCILGRDSSNSSIPVSILRDAAAAFNNEAVMLISPSSFKMLNPINGREVAIGAEYMAAAIGGMFMARDPQVPLTRKSISGGFTDVNERHTDTVKQTNSASGLFVVENKGGILRVRHSLTTATGNVNSREASVVRAKYTMARRLRDSLDRNLIGVVAPLDEVPLLVDANVIGVLETLRVEQVITSFKNVKSRPLSSDPTTVEVRFEYVPAYPINNIIVKFRVNIEQSYFEFV